MIGEAQELKLSDRITVTVAELDGYEQDKADLLVSRFIGGISAEDAKAGKLPLVAMSTLQAPFYAVCSLRAINGVPCNPTHDLKSYEAANRKLGKAEKDALGKWATSVYIPSEEESKNEEAAPED